MLLVQFLRYKSDEKSFQVSKLTLVSQFITMRSGGLNQVLLCRSPQSSHVSVWYFAVNKTISFSSSKYEWSLVVKLFTPSKLVRLWTMYAHNHVIFILASALVTENNNLSYYWTVFFIRKVFKHRANDICPLSSNTFVIYLNIAVELDRIWTLRETNSVDGGRTC